MDSDDFDWDYVVRQFKRDDALETVINQIAKVQGSYYRALQEEGFTKLDAIRIITVTINEVGRFARETVPILVQLFIESTKEDDE